MVYLFCNALEATILELETCKNNHEEDNEQKVVDDMIHDDLREKNLN